MIGMHIAAVSNGLQIIYNIHFRFENLDIDICLSQLDSVNNSPLATLMEMPPSVFSSLRAGGLCMAGTGQHGNTLLLPQHHSLTAKSGEQ